MKNSVESEVMVLTLNEESEKLIETIISVANGNSIKTIIPEQLLTEIKNNAEVGSYFNCESAKKMVILLNESDINNNEKQEILSERENEVLSEIALGKKYKQIAEKLFISVNTVHFHIKKIYQKLNVHSRSEAAVLALRKGLI
jgi:DNA-binding NarL/FixJ family response regulator